MTNLKKRILCAFLSSFFIVLSAVSPRVASAAKGPDYNFGISLEESFSSSTTYTIVEIIHGSDNPGETSILYRKTVTAQTLGYYNPEKRHYVRAYIGGTSTNPSGAEADSYRVWSFGDVSASASTLRITNPPLPPNVFFPIGYAKYGE